MVHIKKKKKKKKKKENRQACTCREGNRDAEILTVQDLGLEGETWRGCRYLQISQLERGVLRVSCPFLPSTENQDPPKSARPCAT